jgi:hypothetical protein
MLLLLFLGKAIATYARELLNGNIAKEQDCS